MDKVIPTLQKSTVHFVTFMNRTLDSLSTSAYDNLYSDKLSNKRSFIKICHLFYRNGDNHAIRKLQ